MRGPKGFRDVFEGVNVIGLRVRQGLLTIEVATSPTFASSVFHSLACPQHGHAVEHDEHGTEHELEE